MFTIKEVDILENWYEMLFASGKKLTKEEGQLIDKLIMYREFLEDINSIYD
jgi:hypothetical protein